MIFDGIGRGLPGHALPRHKSGRTTTAVATDTRAGYSFTLNPKKFGKRFTVQLRTYDRA